MADQDHAVVVAITRYPDFGDLKGPENDAGNFERWLTDPAGGAVPAAQVHRVTTSRFPEPWAGAPQPSLGDINRAFDPLVRTAFNEHRKLGRRLYIFLAGHGFASGASEAALFAADASRWTLGSYVQGRLYADWFRGTGLLDEVVLLMDCCRSLFPAAPAQLPPWKPLNLGPPARRVYGFASAYGQLAREADQAGQVQGLFTRAVLECLTTSGPRDRLGRITGETLKKYSHARLTELSREHALREEQIADFVVDEGVVFAEPTADWGVLVRVEFGPARAGHRVTLLDAGLDEIASHDVVAGVRWERRLGSALYKLKDEATGEVILLEATGREHDVKF
ncbi:MAG TPA: caspase family protein [Longimicrobium sp.]|nr:caspase family protein [Longimicrobium sp.]